MTQDIQPNSEASNCQVNWPLQAALTIGGAATAGGLTALTAAVFTTINPLGGLLFGASAVVVFSVANLIGDATGIKDTFAGKAATIGLSLILSIGAAYAITAAVGFPITIAATLILTAATVALTVGIALVGTGALCCGTTAVCCGIGYLLLSGAIDVPSAVDSFLG